VHNLTYLIYCNEFRIPPYNKINFFRKWKMKQTLTVTIAKYYLKLS